MIKIEFPRGDSEAKRPRIFLKFTPQIVAKYTQNYLIFKSALPVSVCSNSEGKDLNSCAYAE